MLKILGDISIFCLILHCSSFIIVDCLTIIANFDWPSSYQGIDNSFIYIAIEELSAHNPSV